MEVRLTLTTTSEYRAFINEIKAHIQVAQIKAATSVNQELLKLYWFLAEQIVAKQKYATWGDGFIQQMSKDLLKEFPKIKGFSKRNLELMRQWYLFWSADAAIAKQLVSQIPWGHNLVIVIKIKHIDEAVFYAQKTIQNNWSRAVLSHQIESGLYRREGRALTNFQASLPEVHSDLARQTLKDPYKFDFLMLREAHDEKELEDALIQHITKFLLELGAGFCYVGRQYKIEINGEDFFIDLLFYHLELRCFVVVELKKGKFKPEYAGKLNFYCNIVDDRLKKIEDRATIGLILCQDKSEIVADYALKGINTPLGISEYQLTKNLPKDLESVLPSVEEIEEELG